MPVKKATSVYGKGGMNCAQSILCGFKEVCQIVDADIDAAASAGRGGSERGFCGALHAALILARQPETKKALEQAFLENAGSIYCRDIRQLRQIRCRQCVELAATILMEKEHQTHVKQAS